MCLLFVVVWDIKCVLWFTDGAGAGIESLDKQRGDIDGINADWWAL